MARRESIPGPLRLSLSGPTAVHDAVVAANTFAERVGLADAYASRLVIVVEELAMNLYDHGGLGVDDAFDLELSSSRAEVRLVLIAPGPEFDPRQSIFREFSSSRGAGAGLNLVLAWSRLIEHNYVEGRNRLALALPIIRS
jgi:anti-sigma regulatory factor (Ser/Thr protein kinase)